MNYSDTVALLKRISRYEETIGEMKASLREAEVSQRELHREVDRLIGDLSVAVREAGVARAAIAPLRSLAQRLVDMDDPRGSTDRQTVTLNDLIGQARLALAAMPAIGDPS